MQTSEEAQQTDAGGAAASVAAAEPAAGAGLGAERVEQALQQMGGENSPTSQARDERPLRDLPLVRRMAGAPDAEAALDAWLAERPHARSCCRRRWSAATPAWRCRCMRRCALRGRSRAWRQAAALGRLSRWTP